MLARTTDLETITPAALGMIVRQPVTNPASWRADSSLDDWLVAHNLPGISGIDTRALTRRIRDFAPRGALCHAPNGNIDTDVLCEMAKSWPGLKDMDLAKSVTCQTSHHGKKEAGSMIIQPIRKPAKFNVVAMDFGCKHNILRCLKTQVAVTWCQPTPRLIRLCRNTRWGISVQRPG